MLTIPALSVQYIENIVHELNNHIYELIEEEILTEVFSSPLIYFLSDGNSTVINFIEQTIWDSDNDEREFFEETNEYQDLELFLRAKINEIISILKKIKM